MPQGTFTSPRKTQADRQPQLLQEHHRKGRLGGVFKFVKLEEGLQQKQTWKDKEEQHFKLCHYKLPSRKA